MYLSSSRPVYMYAGWVDGKQVKEGNKMGKEMILSFYLGISGKGSF